jgi:O-antigen/teichoic acid export membrane protein
LSGSANPGEPQKASWQAGVLVFGWILQAVSTSLMLLLVVRLMSKADVGVLAALIFINDLVAMIVSAGFPSALMYFLPARPDAERRAIAKRFGGVLVMLGAVAGIVLLLLASLDQAFPELLASFKTTHDGEPVSLAYLFLLVPYPMFDLPARLLPNLLIAEGRARAAAGLGILDVIAKAVFTLVPIALGYGLWVVVGAMVVLGFLRSLLLPLAIRVLYRGAAAVPSPVGTREIFRFAIPLGLHDIVSFLNNRFDSLLIFFSFAAPLFAEYQTGAWQVPFLVTIPYAVGAAYTAELRSLFVAGKPREAIDLWRVATLKSALIVVPGTMVFVVAAEETMTLLFTADYLNAAGVFRWYSIYTLMRVTAFGNVIVAAGRSDYVLVSILVSFASDSVLSILLLLWFGFEGPAMGTALAMLPTVAAFCWGIARAAGLPLRTIFPLGGYLRILGLAAVASLGAIAIKLWVVAHPGVLLVLEGLALLAGFAVLGTLTGTIKREDWRYARDWLTLRVLR